MLNLLNLYCIANKLVRHKELHIILPTFYLPKILCKNIKNRDNSQTLLRDFIDKNHLEKAWNINLRISLRFFNQCFEEEYNTRLVKGGDEPIYIPAMMRCLIMRFTLREAFTAVHCMKLPIG